MRPDQRGQDGLLLAGLGPRTPTRRTRREGPLGSVAGSSNAPET